MMAHANKAGGHGIARPHARGSINPLGVGSIVRTLYPIPPPSARCSAVLSRSGRREHRHRRGGVCGVPVLTHSRSGKMPARSRSGVATRVG